MLFPGLTTAIEVPQYQVNELVSGGSDVSPGAVHCIASGHPGFWIPDPESACDNLYWFRKQIDQEVECCRSMKKYTSKTPGRGLEHFAL